MDNTYDAIVIGAGSIGVPVAFYLTQENIKVLVIDQHPSVGQGQNKSAIGGVRATHSDPAKIQICQESLKIFSSWKEIWGHDIGWKQGGYCFPVYSKKEETTLKNLLPFQKEQSLNINWEGPEVIKELIPGINSEGLRGGTYSPNDGHVSPLLFIDSMYRLSVKNGCVFHFNETVTGFEKNGSKILGITTDRGTYQTENVIIAAGAGAKSVGEMAGIDIPVFPESHEAGITSPFKHFLSPMVVDIRQGKDGLTENFYFTQVAEGAVIFCYTPSPPIPGKNREPTSGFLPTLAGRLIDLLPRTRDLTIRRTWRGLYPMTPDGYPICGAVKETKGLYLATGMCGQGFMLGPGLGKNIANLIINGSPIISDEVFETIGYYRNFIGLDREVLK